MAALGPYLRVTELGAFTEASSSHVTMKCMTRYFTLIDEPYPLNAYPDNPSYTKATEDQRRRYVRRECIGDTI